MGTRRGGIQKGFRYGCKAKKHGPEHLRRMRNGYEYCYACRRERERRACKYGHEYKDGSYKVRVKKSGQESRVCLQCVKEAPARLAEKRERKRLSHESKTEASPTLDPRVQLYREEAAKRGIVIGVAA